MTNRLLRLALLLGWGLLFVLPGLRSAEAAAWRDLTGRVAPDLTFKETAQGLPPQTRLSSFRSKKVVLLAFWLRDCPHCKRALPKVQALHERSRRSGLQVISIVHDKYALSKVLPVMKTRGWTFPVARDVKGEMARRYGGGRRPGFYVIGIDGRVKASNALSEGIVERELTRWRLYELGRMPAALKQAESLVGARNYGEALRTAEAIGNKAGATAEIRAAVARLAKIAGQKLQNRVDRAEALFAKRSKAGTAQARAEYAGILASFRGTSLESRARALQAEFVAKAGAPPK